ncbi:MAG: P-II family nitrogen regulator [Thermoguttaceae bacterium]
MKQVIAIIKPYLVEKVLDALRLAPLEACSLREVKGYGRQKNYLDQYKGSEYSLAFLPKVEITLWVDDLRLEEVIRTIVETARTGRMGDGKIFVLPSGPQGDWADGGPQPPPEAAPAGFEDT